MFLKPELTCLSLTGRKHTEKNMPNEDACFTMSENNVHVICISDGAGGSFYTHAGIGSVTAVQTIAKLMTKHFDAFFMDVRENVVRSIIVTAIQSELAIKAKEHHLKSIDKMAATFMFCAVKDTRVIFGHIGDGLIARVTSSGVVPVTLPQNGEDASSTYFVTFPDAQDYLRIVRTTTDDAHAFVLMTDGISESVFDSSTYHVLPVVARLAEFGAPNEVDRYSKLESAIGEHIIQRSPLSDDATIGIMYFSGTPAPDFDSLPKEKPVPQINFSDLMKNVQMEILPRVKLARELFRKAREEQPSDTQSDTVSLTSETTASGQLIEEIKDPSPAREEVDESVADHLIDTVATKEKYNKRFKSGKRVYLFCVLGILLVSVTIALFFYYR
ncbi:MAG: protein phosphatase 2C domain-containing protein [Clostridiaceae bacterium]|nr:protein phosphatase 2C domain-containing protein [Clostridiaceae bacterium]